MSSEPREQVRGHGSWRRFFFGKLPLETETGLFILVNVLDYMLTYLLIMQPGRGVRFVESNPVAQHFIESWGAVKGLLGFKMAVVAFVCVVAQLIALKREDYGRFVLILGTLATGAVVAYSVMLYLRHT